MREDCMAAAGGRALSEAREALTRCHGESAHLHMSLIAQAEACTQHFHRTVQARTSCGCCGRQARPGAWAGLAKHHGSIACRMLSMLLCFVLSHHKQAVSTMLGTMPQIASIN